MRTHAEIDRRSLALARAVAAERDPRRRGREQARATCERWLREAPAPVLAEWRDILGREWEQVRAVLLDEREAGRRLRQSNPFCGIISPQQRWDIYRRFAGNGFTEGANHESQAT